MSLFPVRNLFSALVFSTFALPIANAQSAQEIDNFILQSTIKPYDCPEDNVSAQVAEYLMHADLTDMQRRQLTVKQTHHQICVGKHEDAKSTLRLIVDENTDQSDLRYYAEATYQLGFIYDIQENDARCAMYRLTQQNSQDTFADLHLSASLGLITVCNSDEDEGVKLGQMYALLERYSSPADNAALAHIHNNIGLFYASMGQHVLAAEQYQKSYDLGFSTYTGSNKLATLISAISAHMASGDFEQAKRVIEEFKRVNESVDTALSNVWLHFSEAGYYYRTDNMPELKRSLAKWRVYLDEINSSMYNGLFRWYSAVPCLAEKDEACLLAFLEEEAAASDGYKNFINRNKDYLRFQVEIQLFLGNVEEATKQFNRFADVMLEKVMDQQASGKVLGVANLHNQILTLESSLQASRSNRFNNIVAVSIAAAILVLAVLLWLRRKYVNSLNFDPVTNLFNSKTALNKIRRVPSPSTGRTNALALFDLGNFRDVNRQIGAANSDLALQQIAETLSQVTRDRDILGRFAPEQFIVCLTDIEEDSAKSFFERMRYALENTILGSEQGQKVSIRSSMSIYVANDTFDDLEEILNDMLLSLGIHSDNQ